MSYPRHPRHPLRGVDAGELLLQLVDHLALLRRQAVDEEELGPAHIRGLVALPVGVPADVRGSSQNMFDTQVCVCRERGRASHLDLASPSCIDASGCVRSGARSPAEAEAQPESGKCPQLPNSSVLVGGKARRGDGCATTGAAAPLIMMMVDQILTYRAISDQRPRRQMKSAADGGGRKRGTASRYPVACGLRRGFESRQNL